MITKTNTVFIIGLLIVSAATGLSSISANAQPNQNNPPQTAPPPAADSANGNAPDTGFAVNPGNPPEENNSSKANEDPALPNNFVGGLSRRDPFSLPEYILIKIRQKSSEKSIVVDTIDENSPPIIRWPLNSYQLVGIIWDVRKPKAMFIDRMKNVHIVKELDSIGNLRGVITKIRQGSVTVKEGQIPQVIKLNK